MLETILYYASMWSPSIVAILGIIATVIVALGKVVNAIQEWKTSSDNGTAAATQLHADIQSLAAQNAKLQQYNQKLLEELTRIKGYDIDISEDT